MLILDLDYLDSVSEENTMHLHGGGNASAITAYLARAFGHSTYTGTVAVNQAVAGTGSPSASSYVQATAVSGGSSASSSATSVFSLSSVST
ncbi:hypothetical protein HW132_00215 [Brasilonema sp. CT11]|nr:hypothetical protein [Brasilonema sp. CT11]